MADAMSAVLETTQAERLATGFVFTEGPLWHPDGFYYFVDVRASMLYRVTPGRPHEVVREKTGGGNGTTFDLQGRLVREIPLGPESNGVAQWNGRDHEGHLVPAGIYFARLISGSIHAQARVVLLP